MKDKDLDIDLPLEEDENVGDGAPEKKKIKKRKTKEERQAERKVVFWTLMIVLGVTIFFWIWPKLRELSFNGFKTESSSPKEVEKKSGPKNYIEYKL